MTTQMPSMASLQAPEFVASCLLLLATILLFKLLLLAPPPKKKHAGAASPALSLPSPRGLPLIGNLHQVGALPHRSLAALAAAHAAPLMLLRLGSAPTLVVSTAAAARALFQENDDRALLGRPALYAATRLSYGLRNISFAPHDSAFWRAARRACGTELLGAPRVRGFRTAREREAAALVNAVAAVASGGSPVNLSDMVIATSTRILRRVAFGGVDCDGEIDMDVKAVLDETQNLLGGFWFADYFPWLRWLDSLRGMRRRLERLFHQLDALYDRVIDDHRSKRKDGSGENDDDLVDVLLRLHGDPAHRSTFGNSGHIKGILTDMFNGGSDTSAVTVEWAMTELVRNPDALAKAQREVRRVVTGENITMVREADLPELHYLRLVIRETLRLHPALPLLVPRETTEPCTVNNGAVKIPPGTRVLINAMAIHTDPGVWGPDADRFVPERHENGEGSDGFALVPFGIGRRSCPGVHFATAVVELLLANLLFGFDWGVREVDVAEVNGLAVRKKNPLVLVATKKGNSL
uniref:Cytochrome P450 n=1 Tax=Leersia perrieri TaxID=77586 RepID=A0A0D9W6A2_9ORYZ